ncbi:hypothetical protein [Thiolapillus sp.]
MKRTQQRQQQPRCILVASFALTASAALLIFAFLFWNTPVPGERKLPSPIKITQEDFIIDPANGSPIPGGVEIIAPGPEKQILLPITKRGFQASRFARLHYRIENYSPGLMIKLYWRSSDSPDTTRFMRLHPGFLPQASLPLAQNPGWKGEITLLGLSLQGGITGDKIIIRDLKFFASGAESPLSMILSDWSRREPWSMSSINFVFNGSPYARPSPVLASAAWLSLALLLFMAWNRYRFRRFLPPTCAPGLLFLILIPWLILYGRWQLNLWSQFNDSRQLYSGRSQEEKQLRAEDAAIYRYAQHLKHDLLPQQPARIFILDNTYRSYLRLKTQYHLLPHNSYNYDRFPQAAYLHDGDYLLVLGNIPGLHFNRETQQLEWPGEHKIKAHLLDQSSLGNLYRVELSDRENRP